MFSQPFIPPQAPEASSKVARIRAGDSLSQRAEVFTFRLTGLDAHLVRVVAEVHRGPTQFQVVGLPEPQARETRVRVRSALQEIGVDLAPWSITVRFEPAGVVATGSADAAIAIAIVTALGQIGQEQIRATAIIGALSLRGGVQSVRGVLPMLRGATSSALAQIVVPRVNGAEAAQAPGVNVGLVEHLRELVNHLALGVPLERAAAPSVAPLGSPLGDLSEIRGQHGARRALEIAAAGGHSLLMIGGHGCGATALARRLPGILPEPSAEEALDITGIHSVAGLLSPERAADAARPFRAPHHTVSAAGLLGGGDPVRPGEVTLAHHGVLFLDELAEFRTSTLESLAQILCEGHAAIVRKGVRITFPAGALLVAATHACPCGFSGDASRRCMCSTEHIARYQAHLRGPVADFCDLRIALPPIGPAELQREGPGEPSVQVRARVTAARTARLERGGAASAHANLTPSELKRVGRPDAAGGKLLAEGAHRVGLSARAIARIVRVARTIADLGGAGAVGAPHIAEALSLATGLEDLRTPALVPPDAP